MEIKIQAINFEAGEKLQDYVQKRVGKLTRFYAEIKNAEVVLKVVKPETAANKEGSIRLALPGGELYAQKVADTFEEVVDLCADTLTRQLEKYKEKQKNR